MGTTEGADTSFIRTTRMSIENAFAQILPRVCVRALCSRVSFSEEGSPFSFLLSSLVLESQFCVQLSDVIVKVFLGLVGKAKHEEDLVMHEKRGEN